MPFPDPGYLCAPGWSTLLIPIPVHHQWQRARPLSSSDIRTIKGTGENDGCSMRSLGGMVTTFGNHRSHIPVPPSPSSFSVQSSTSSSTLLPKEVAFDSSCIHPASVHTLYSSTSGQSVQSIQIRSGDVSACHPASPYFHSHRLTRRLQSTVTSQPSRSSSKLPHSPGVIHPKDLWKPDSFFIPLTPSSAPRRQTTVIDVSSEHPASMCSSPLALIEEDKGDVTCVHPASSAFSPKQRCPRTSQSADIDSLVYPTLEEDKSYSDTPLASIPLPLESAETEEEIENREIDIRIVHPASIGYMSVTHQTPLLIPHQSSMPRGNNFDSKMVHPAAMGNGKQISFGPSESRYIHPASSSFRTFDPSTTHPASIHPSSLSNRNKLAHKSGYRTPLVDMGDSRTSHPGWIGFGLAKPQKPKL